MFWRLQLCCSKPTEFAYYASSLGKKDFCCYCSANRAEKNAEQAKLFKVMLPCAKPVGMPKRRSWSANLSKNRHQKHLLDAFAKIAVQWRLWWSNILATLQVQTLLLSIFSRFSKHVLSHLEAILNDKFVVSLDILQNFQKSVIL